MCLSIPPASPTTPRRSRESTPPPISRRSTPPPMSAGWMRGKDRSPLQLALESRSVQGVKNVIAADPAAASAPFMEECYEPPLCFAVRIGSDAAVIELLLQGGADVNEGNICGDSALGLLLNDARKKSCQQTVLFSALPLLCIGSLNTPGHGHLVAAGSPLGTLMKVPMLSFNLRQLEAHRVEQQVIRVANVLLAAGAHVPEVEWVEPSNPHAQTEYQATWVRLARLCRNFRNVQACRVILKAAQSQMRGAHGCDGQEEPEATLATLPFEVSHLICGFLVPQSTLRSLASGDEKEC
mmetsp:Transcript_50208/g.144401  ORF Transcript_50208/g.144401 Transcript_50208/m.144401 type:complete len:296 (-) Transcript_50208:108-995(-)|eukprot:CAMPEP_0177167246 /NCGR_PEP_ID=MMETSP0367-20130122/8452_1 /TAXON_ID=447022 ORGANISM="Scrippsiella hangoei-like, Strain SHHI-4" /NCGR_SAMPLE_ID=MMETSP0367 /ASSEMBLY_ACC=CAM_ASM_000362 /LENGTH=295 /DNA_ID=CAMNT_0018613343 /DNA_START=22 /DNA_END=909 /DNA_ORIENTATION=-